MTSDDRQGAGERSSAPLASDPFKRKDEPVWRVTLWPHRSLSPDGFRTVMICSAAAMAFPVLAFAGTPFLWALVPYVLAALFALWAFFKINYRRARLTEELRLWPDAIAVERREPAGAVYRWSANPYWVDVDLEDTKAVQRYLTLRGAGRRIELGAFLTPDERTELASEIRSRIRRLKRSGA
ncbi:MAG: DUF2244 domain-containing protein [Pseudomonadota bacterium]